MSKYLKEFVADMHEAMKFLEQDKCKQIANLSHEVEAPRGSKKWVYIQMIAGDPTITGESRRAIKRYNESPILGCTSKDVNFASQNHSRVPRVLDHPIPILFMEKNKEGILYPHDDALVITLKVATSKVARTLVDTSSSVDIIFKSTLDQLLIESPRITYMTRHLSVLQETWSSWRLLSLYPLPLARYPTESSTWLISLLWSPRCL